MVWIGLFYCPWKKQFCCPHVAAHHFSSSTHFQHVQSHYMSNYNNCRLRQDPSAILLEHQLLVLKTMQKCMTVMQFSPNPNFLLVWRIDICVEKQTKKTAADLTKGKQHRVCSAISTSDIVVDYTGVRPTHIPGKRRRDVHRCIGHYGTVEEPLVDAGWIWLCRAAECHVVSCLCHIWSHDN